MCNEFHRFQEFAVHTELKSVDCSGKQTLRRVWLRTHETPVICSAEPQLQIFLQLSVDQRLCQCGIYLLSHEVLHHTLDIPDFEKFQGAFRHPSKHDLNWSFSTLRCVVPPRHSWYFLFMEYSDHVAAVCLDEKNNFLTYQPSESVWLCGFMVSKWVRGREWRQKEETEERSRSTSFGGSYLLDWHSWNIKLCLQIAEMYKPY